MIVMWLLVGILFQVSTEPFTLFTFCHEFPGSGSYEKQCLELKPDGSGNGSLKSRDSEEMSSPLALSPAARDKFLLLLRATRNLADHEKYESSRRVANLGRKRLILQTGTETREAEFNYSDLREVEALTTFLDAVLNQQALVADLEIAAKYERLSVPERIQQLETELKMGRIGDPVGLIPALDKIIQNERILSYAREDAERLKIRLLISN